MTFRVATTVLTHGGDSNLSIPQELLSAKGRFYLVAIAQNNVQSILSRVREASRNLEGTVCIFSSSFVPTQLSFPSASRSSYPAELDVNTCMCSDSRGRLLQRTRSLLGLGRNSRGRVIGAICI